jgi:hypothetical protein
MKDMRWPRISRSLRRLCTKGAESWWIIERAPALLELECVRRAAGEQPGSRGRATALIRILRELVLEFLHEPHGVLLWIVLGLESDYVGSDGEHYHLLDLNAFERRTLAGAEFRGGRHRVGANAIRLHHEPVAVARLSHLLLRREIELTGFLRADGAYDTDYVPIYLSGEPAPVSGMYLACDLKGIPVGRELVIQQGDPFPLTLPERNEAGWRMRNGRMQSDPAAHS